MTTENIGLFKALSAKMSYLDQRQRIISQNVANADTPGYQPYDLTPVDFGAVLKGADGENHLRPAATDARHMPAAGEIEDPRSRESRKTYEIAPAGNAVILEEQMLNANTTTMDYNLMTSLYQKNVNMIRMALGRGQ